MPPQSLSIAILEEENETLYSITDNLCQITYIGPRIVRVKARGRQRWFLVIVAI